MTVPQSGTETTETTETTTETTETTETTQEQPAVTEQVHTVEITPPVRG